MRFEGFVYCFFVLLKSFVQFCEDSFEKFGKQDDLGGLDHTKLVKALLDGGVSAS